MNWVMLTGMICLTIAIIQKFGLVLGGIILIVLAILIELL